ncbi:acetyl-CoA synthetase-like protein [Thozetella sp. PMI_491]|nr:acetyl-CoA synthetase-like protein [Thozetella sp. PMI_491]
MDSTSNATGDISTIVLVETSKTLQIPVGSLRMHSSFAENCGDSVHALWLSSACRLRGISLGVSAILKAPNLEQLARSAAYCPITTSPPSSCLDASVPPRRRRPSLLYHACKPRSRKRARASKDGLCPVSETQRSLLHCVGERRVSNVIHYAVQWPTWRLPEVKWAWNMTLASEPIFCSAFEELDGCWYFREGECFVEPAWRQRFAEDAGQYAHILQSSRREVPLDVAEKLSFTIITPSPSWDNPNSTVVWHVHHALVDSFSRDILLRKLGIILGGGLVEKGPSFAAFTTSMQVYQAQRSAQAEAFWRQQKERYGEPSSNLALPPIGNACLDPADPEQESVAFKFRSDRLQNAARGWRVGAASLYFTAWAATLSTISNANHVRFGAVLNGRNVPIEGIDAVVGPLLVTLPLTLRIDPSGTAMSLAKHINSRLLELSDFSWTLPRHGYHQDYSSALSVQLDGKSSFSIAQNISTTFVSSIPLSVSVELGGLVRLQYHTAKMNRIQASNIARIFSQVLSGIANQPSDSIQAPLLSMVMPPDMDAELRAQSQCYSEGTMKKSSNEDVTLVSLFRHAASQRGEDVAVEKGEATMTYRSLDQLSDIVAQAISVSVRPGDVVGVHADGSLHWIVAIYAVLKVGAVYCPLSETLPARVRDEQAAAANSVAFLTPNPVEMTATCRAASCCHHFSVVDILEAACASQKPAQSAYQSTRLTADSPAYLCFTSGSSGRPKGVLCKHDSLVALQRDFDVRLRAKPGWRIAQTMSASFDGSIHEIFSALSYGATLVLKNKEDPFEHLHSVDAALLTPTVANALQPASFERLSVMYLVGESVPQHVCDAWASRLTLFNMYGPTEATCGATIARLAPGVPVTIGKPNPSTRLYILDRNLNLSPPGIVGEIFLGGIQVSAGYIGMPEAHEERFLDDTVCPSLGEKMYKTGDRGFWDEAGQVHFLGRHDRQIKYRGFRIDLDDIQARVRAAVPEAHGAALVLKDNRLVAILMPETLQLPSVRQRLAAFLPSHMVPAEVCLIEKFPMTGASKLDYSALIRGIDAMPKETSGHAYTGPLQDQLADLWRQILHLPPTVELNGASSFIEMGGESMSALKLQSKIQQMLNRTVVVKQILGTSTLQELAEVVQSTTPIALAMQPAQKKDIPLPEDAATLLSSMERALWIQDGGDMRSAAMNVSLLLRLDSTVDGQRLEAALNRSLARHEVFRSRYHGLESLAARPFRTLSPRAPRVTRLAEQDLDATEQVNRPFHLECEDPIRVILTPTQLLIVAHHIVCDLTALRKVLHEVRQAYHGERIPTDDQGSSYISHVLSPTYGGGDDLESRLRFWDAYMASRPNKPSSKSAPTIDAGLAASERKGTSFVFRVRRGFWTKVESFSRLHNVTMHQFLMAAGSLAMSHHSDPDGDENANDNGALAIDTVLGAPHMNREQLSPRYQDMVGLFLQPLPMRIRWSSAEEELDRSEISDAAAPRDCTSLGPSDSVPRFLRAVKRSSEQALSHVVPWEALCQRLAAKPGPSTPPREPLFDVMLTLHRSVADWDDVIIPGLSPRFTFAQGAAKFNFLIEWIAPTDPSPIMHRGECWERQCCQEEKASEGEGLVRVEYRHTWARACEVETLAAKMVIAAECIAGGEVTMESVWAEMRALDRGERDVKGILLRDHTGNDFFGVELPR